MFKPEGSDCATVLFGLGKGSFGNETDSSTNWNESNFTQPTQQSSGVSSNVLGCISSFIKGQQANDGHLEIKLAFRNDNTGWFLRSKLSSGNSYVLTHNLFLLEKDVSGQTWSLKTGLEWTDSQLKTLSSSDQVSVKIPWETNPKTITLGTYSSAASKLVGVWKSETGTDKKGILEEVSLKKESASSDVFEKTGEEIVTSTIEATKVYDITSNKWKSVDTNASNKNIKETLNAWYKPFKEVKGIWVGADSYCTDTGTSEESKIQGICVRSSSGS